jgi:predicted aconitase with swiveling domain
MQRRAEVNPTMQESTARTLRVDRAYGPIVEGEAVVSEEGFSPRYDLDRWSGIITKPGHKLEGISIKDKICFFPTAKGGIAAGWAFNDIKGKGIAPKAFIFGITNPVMVQGAIFAGITITEGWDRDPRELIRTGDWVRVDPRQLTITLVRQRGDGT